MAMMNIISSVQLHTNEALFFTYNQITVFGNCNVLIRTRAKRSYDEGHMLVQNHGNT